MSGQKNGFTLVEILIVLSIFIVMSFASLMVLKPQFFLLEKNLFFSEFTTDLLLAQQYALSHHQEVTVNISPSSHSYYIRKRGEENFIIRRQYSKSINIREGTMPSSFQYLPDGNTNKFGSFFVYIGDKAYRVTFLIGSGRFYVVEA
ncbi:competence type IV pilus minor pilin ComGD [Mesobacillus zeae]|uniref:competence type IV pilus minor pilin ComGD n=1 Tax=Mesobacillus zeae TaxID=1917180 RepID=UPI003009D4A0